MSFATVTSAQLARNLDLPAQSTVDAIKRSGAPLTAAAAAQNADFAEFGTPMAMTTANAGTAADMNAPQVFYPDNALSQEALALNASSGTVTMTINLGFDAPTCGGGTCMAKPVQWAFSDAARAIMESELKTQFKQYNPAFSVPISMKVLGTNLGEFENYFALEATDGSNPPRALHTMTGFKIEGNASLQRAGYPLYMLKSGQNKVLFNPASFNAEHIKYWNLNMDMLRNDVSTVNLPGMHTEQVILRADSQAASLTHYALSEKNSIVQNFISNPEFFYNGSPEFLVLNKNVYNAVVNAFENKFQEIKNDSFDFSTLNFRLSALPGMEHKPKLDTVPMAYVSLELTAHMGYDMSPGMEHKAVTEMSNGMYSTAPDMFSGVQDI